MSLLKLSIFGCVYMALLNMASSQVYNRILPNYSPNVLPFNEANIVGLPPNYHCDLPYEILSNILPGQIQPNLVPLPNVLQSLPNVLQPLPNVLQPLPNVLQPLSVLQPGLPNVLQPLPNVLQSLPNVLPPVAPTIIQDGSVANSLANALQLLVVSNLLSNKLPLGERVVGYPPVEYISPSRYNYVL